MSDSFTLFIPIENEKLILNCFLLSIFSRYIVYPVTLEIIKVFRSALRVVMSSQKPLVAFVLGGPGAGKGTQCEKIVERFGFVHLSAGELLRQERDSGSKDGNLIQDCIKEGKIVPVAITISLLQKAMEKSPVKKFLVDGFPRNEDNLQGWSERMDDVVDVKCVLFFDCPEEECIRRIVERGKTSGRTDDNIDSLRKRFNTYKEQTMPIINHYQKLNLVKTIPATGTPDEVFEDVKKAINSILE